MIRLRDVSIRQGDFEVSDVNLEVPAGSYTMLMGRSGCGKTTVLEIICGLRQVSSGLVMVGDRDVTGLKPAERGVGYVPQDRALFPTYLVRDQLAFSLVLRDWSDEQIDARVNELAKMLEITHLLDRMPEGLSGGEAQRITLGRALAAEPSVMLLDEPISALDAELHDEMCDLLADVHRRTGVTILHITHNPAEADRLADQRLRMEAGVITKV